MTARGFLAGRLTQGLMLALFGPGVLALVLSAAGLFGDPLSALLVAAAICGVLAGSRDPAFGATLRGLIAGVLLASLGWGSKVIFDKLQSCQDGCSGLDSGSLTVVIVVGVTLVGVVAGCIGFALGRIARRRPAKIPAGTTAAPAAPTDPPAGPRLG
jgi:hypothetical protein